MIFSCLGLRENFPNNVELLQMHGQRRVAISGNEKQDSPSSRGGVGISSPLYYNSPPGGMYLPSRSPVDSPTPPPLRQGVIQRHNTIPSQVLKFLDQYY